ncbi:MAG: hypothetical protein O6931_02785 [Gammaproteobacteria bacterium]|nr:hypothetical protein [Gammaproteobacteria bacterium]
MTDLIQKLQIRDGMQGAVFELPSEVGLGLVNSTLSDADFAIAFVNSCADVRRLAKTAAGALKEDGILWFCYPKKSSGVETDINRDKGWEPLSTLGYRGVRQISIDSVWSAIRFRETGFVRKK